MLIKRQRTVQNHTQDFKFVSRGYCATSNGDSLWNLWDAQTLLVPMYITSDLSGFSRKPFWLNQACNAVTHCWKVAKEASSYEISLKSDNRSMSYGKKKRNSNFNFLSRDCNRVQYLTLCTKFHQNRTIFLLRYGDLTIFKMAAVRHLGFYTFAFFCPVALVSMPFCFLVQNFAEIRQSVDDLWPKKRFSRWRPPIRSRPGGKKYLPPALECIKNHWPSDQKHVLHGRETVSIFIANLSVRPSIRYVPVLYENGLMYFHSFFSPFGSPVILHCVSKKVHPSAFRNN